MERKKNDFLLGMFSFNNEKFKKLNLYNKRLKGASIHMTHNLRFLSFTKIDNKTGILRFEYEGIVGKVFILTFKGRCDYYSNYENADSISLIINSTRNSEIWNRNYIFINKISVIVYKHCFNHFTETLKKHNIASVDLSSLFRFNDENFKKEFKQTTILTGDEDFFDEKEQKRGKK